jgi:hypothetical protein
MQRSYLKADVRFYRPEKGGRAFVPVSDGYAPYLRAATLSTDLPARLNGIPSNGKYDTSYEVEIELSYHPKLDYSSLTEGSKVELVEGPKVVGEGIVTSKIYTK